MTPKTRKGDDSGTAEVYRLLYDDACSLCEAFKERVKERDRRNLLVPIPFSDPRIREMAPQLTAEELTKSFHLVFPDGRVVSGARAIPELLELLPGHKPLAWLLRLPGAGWLSEKVYLWMASRRA